VVTDWLAQLGILGHVALAIVFGGLIGIEREYADKPAGFRTHMLVAGSAALLVSLGHGILSFFESTGIDGGTVRIQSDPMRIVEAVITGVSFLGAGTIFRRSRTEQVEGLTTAASLLLSAAIGVSVALRQYILAAGVTVLGLIILRWFRFMEGWIDRRRGLDEGRDDARDATGRRGDAAARRSRSEDDERL
jgi:putative Mg2+ transporter-C (MgtC) family protein